MAANNAKSDKPDDAEGQKSANIPAAESINTSGAPQQIVPGVDMSHPAVDSDPRAGTTVDQNRIDFNDPTIPGHDAVAQALNEQGVPTQGGTEAAASAKTASKK